VRSDVLSAVKTWLWACEDCSLLSHYTPWRRLGGRRYSSYSFSTSALDVGEWSASLLSRALAQGKGPPVPIVQEAGRASESVWTQRLEEKSYRLCRGSNLISLSSPCVRLVRPVFWTVCVRVYVCLSRFSLLTLKTKVRSMRSPCCLSVPPLITFQIIDGFS
jgi:hypothetical protein